MTSPPFRKMPGPAETPGTLAELIPPACQEQHWALAADSGDLPKGMPRMLPQHRLPR
jgi:hypothetical protein